RGDPDVPFSLQTLAFSLSSLAPSSVCPPFSVLSISAFQLLPLSSRFLLSAFQDFRISAFARSTFPFQLPPLRRIITRLFVMGGTILQSRIDKVSLQGAPHAQPSQTNPNRK
ncbi:MAG: hypothetical protein NT154_45100, partial [Verrucomicrobia bacterium]|nr:hypothetical protein [Verrucomicrobiota bacterium]